MLSRLADFLRFLWRFLRRVGRRFVAERCARTAAALSYTTVLALVPLMTVALALLSVFPAFRVWLTDTQQFVFRHFVPASGEAVSRYLDQFVANAGRLTAWGLLFLFVTALMLMSTIERAFHDIWHAPPPRRHRQVLRLLAYWAVLMTGPLLIGVSLSLSSYVMSLPLFAVSAPLGFFRTFVFQGLPVALEFLAFMLLYTIVPNRPVRLRHALIGAAAAAVLFELAKRGFGLFVAHFSSYQLIYGAIAALPVFLVWVYLSWMIVLAGAVLTVELPSWRLAAKGVRAPPPRTESARKRK